jgi:hypothetical protein
MSRGVGLGTNAHKLTTVIWPVGSMYRDPMYITIVFEYDAVLSGRSLLKWYLTLRGARLFCLEH